MSTPKVIKIGGSLLSPSLEAPFNFNYANELITTLRSITGNMVLICGGGKTSRQFQELAAQKNGSHSSQHKIGVAAINLNAEMLHSQFQDEEVEPEIVKYEQVDNEDSIASNYKFTVVAAGSPGHSSDYNAFRLATKAGASQVVSLSNTDGIYAVDPRTNPDAERFTDMTWDDYLGIINNITEHKPGASYPVDPVAARYAQERAYNFFTLDGNDFEGLRRYLINGDTDMGTLISG